VVAVLGQAAGLGGPHIIEGFVHFGDDVKAIEDIDRVGAALADDPQVRLPHIRADEFDALGQRLADESEELLETLDGAILTDPQQPCAALLDLIDQGQILVPFGVLDLVDADGLDRPQIAMLQPPLDYILHRLADFVPGAAERHGGFLPG
jgi:hypothetical protein